MDEYADADADESYVINEVIKPVEGLGGDQAMGDLEEGMALCLSGGGYRAMLFHAGALWRLNDAGLLPRLDRVSSVSGGSITAGVLGLAWPKLEFDSAGVARGFEREVIGPLRRLAGEKIDIRAALCRVFGSDKPARYVARAYGKFLFGRHTLQDLPDDSRKQGPRFVINASNLQSGALWRFSKPYAADYRVGTIRNPRIRLAIAVAASAALPPFLSPLVLRCSPSRYSNNVYADLQYAPYTTNVVLTDGSVYDSLAIETAWNRYKTVLVSDGGSQIVPTKDPAHSLLYQFSRIRDITDHNVRSLRKRQLLYSYMQPPGTEGHRYGAFWGIGTNIEDYGVTNPMTFPPHEAKKLANEPTRLYSLSARTQMGLINWGYAACDASLRSATLNTQLDAEVISSTAFPYRSV